MEDGDPTNHRCLSGDDENRNQPQQFPGPAALPFKEELYQELGAVIVEVGSNILAPFCHQFMKTTENNNMVLLGFIVDLKSSNIMLKNPQKQLTTRLNHPVLERKEIISRTSGLIYDLFWKSPCKVLQARLIVHPHSKSFSRNIYHHAIKCNTSEKAVPARKKQ